MNKLTRSILLSAVVLSFVTACDDPPSDSAIGVAAYVAGQPVYIDEVRYYLESNLVVDEATDELQPGTLDEVKSRLFDAMLDERMLYAEADRQGIEVSPLEVAAYLDLGASDVDDDAEVRRRRQIEAHQRLMVQKLQERMIRDRPTLTDDEIATYAVDHGERLLPAKPLEMRALQMASMKQAKRVHREIRRKRMTFNEAALAYEPSPGQALPTRMSWESLPGDLRETLQQLNPGQVSKPLELHNEIYLFQVGKWLSDPADHDDELLRRARRELEGEHNRNILDALLRDLRNQAEVRIKKSSLTFTYVPRGEDQTAARIES